MRTPRVQARRWSQRPILHLQCKDLLAKTELATLNLPVRHVSSPAMTVQVGMPNSPSTNPSSTSTPRIPPRACVTVLPLSMVVALKIGEQYRAPGGFSSPGKSAESAPSTPTFQPMLLIVRIGMLWSWNGFPIHGHIFYPSLC